MSITLTITKLTQLPHTSYLVTYLGLEVVFLRIRCRSLECHRVAQWDVWSTWRLVKYSDKCIQPAINKQQKQISKQAHNMDEHCCSVRHGLVLKLKEISWKSRVINCSRIMVIWRFIWGVDPLSSRQWSSFLLLVNLRLISGFNSECWWQDCANELVEA